MPITYSYAAILAVAEDIKRFTDDMDGDLDQLYTRFTALFAQDWSGEAGTAVDAAREKWNAGAQDIKTVLASVGQKLVESAERMQQVDRGVANDVPV